MAIDSVEREERLRSAMTLAASRDAEKMEALRLAVCEFTFAHRADGLTPEGVLVALKNLIDNRTMPRMTPHESDWNGHLLRERISTWCIKAYFNADGACT